MSSGILSYTSDLRDYVWKNGLREHPALKELRTETARLPHARMQICPEQGALMGNLIRLLSAKRTIEIGTYTGYSAMAVALALPEDGEVLACDISEEWTSIGKKAWEKAGISHKINLQLAPALDTLDKLLAKGKENSFDFAFIDADKKNYQDYYEYCLKLLRLGGVITIDNVLWSGAVIDKERNDSDTSAIRELNQFIYNDERVIPSMIPVGDGLTIVVKI
tara:strand:- start:172 stop:834 length:663 start_codon:yes stop_codon:yes gene_type:complete